METNKKLIEEIKRFPENKQKAITSKSKYLKITAGAGAGKTTTLAMKIVYLLCNGTQPREIVAFTFTEKAAQNIKNKIFELVEKIKPELYNFLGEMYIGTMHGFCFQILQDYFGYGNYDVLEDNKEVAFLLNEGWSFGFGNRGNYTENCLRFLHSISVVYEELLDLKVLEADAYGFYDRFKKYENLLEDHKLLTFAQMTYLLVNKLKKDESKLKYIKHLIVDEYQDINKAQQSLISIIGKWANVYAVGDPRQCIYQWRGSDKIYFDKFEELFNDAESIDIPENFRSDSSIVKVANLFADTLTEKYTPMIPMKDEPGKVVKFVFENPKEEAEEIVAKIKECVKNGICNYSDIAILLRSVKTSGAELIDVLRENEVPYIVGGKIGLFRREEAKLLGMIFAWSSPQGFWSKGMYASGRLEGEELHASIKSTWQGIFKGEVFPEKLLNKWQKEIVAGSYKDLTDAFQELLLILGFIDLDLEDKNNAAIFANLGRFNTLLTDFQTAILFRGREFNWNSHLKGLSWFMSSYGLGAYEEQPAEDIRGIDAIQIMTIHQAKGLEWSVVFIPAMINSRFPSTMSGREQTWDLPRKIFPAERYEGNEDDERRLFYVTITRAKKAVYLSYFRKINRATKESDFLKDLNLSESPITQSIDIKPLDNSNSEEEIQTFSPGELIDYCRCNYCYKLRHLWGYQSQFDRMLGFGKSLHHVLRRISEVIKEKSIEPEKAVDKIIDEEGFHLPFANRLTKEITVKKVRETLKKYASTYKQDLINTAEVESRVEFPIEKATISGRVDVILGPKESLEVRDYKTSDKVTTKDEASFQVKLYSLGLNLMDKNIKKGSIAYIKEMDIASQIENVDVSSKSLEEAKKKAAEVIKNIKAGICKPNKEASCNSLDFAKICKYNKNKKRTVLNLE